MQRKTLMLVTSPHPNLVAIASEAAAGGVDIIQLRDKQASREDLIGTVAALRQSISESIKIVVNSGLEPFELSEADGFHIPDFANPAAVNALRRAGKIVGHSVHTSDGVRSLSKMADYLVFGSVYTTNSHPGEPPQGLARLRDACLASECPIYAIGGITPERVPECLLAGASGIAVLSGILGSSDPRQAALCYRQALDASADAKKMKITANGDERVVEEGSTLSTFLMGLGLHERMVVVEYNGEILSRSKFSDVILAEGDNLEIVQMMAGG